MIVAELVPVTSTTSRGTSFATGLGLVALDPTDLASGTACAYFRLASPLPPRLRCARFACCILRVDSNEGELVSAVAIPLGYTEWPRLGRHNTLSGRRSMVVDLSTIKVSESLHITYEGANKEEDNMEDIRTSQRTSCKRNAQRRWTEGIVAQFQSLT